MSRTCNNGTTEDNIETVCYQGCLITAVENTDPKDKDTYVDHLSTYVYVCADNHTSFAKSPLTHNCTNGVFTPPTSEVPTCHPDMPDLDCLFIVSDAPSVDDCYELEDKINKYAPFTHSQLAATTYKNYLRQWEVIKYIEENYVISREERTRFGILKNNDDDCEGAVSRAFSQSHLAPQSLANLVAADTYTCANFRFDKLIKCVLKHGFEGHTMTRKHVAIVFTTDDDLTRMQTMRRAIMYWKRQFRSHLLDIRYVVIETRPRSHESYVNSEEYFSKLLGDGSFTTRATLFNGKFIGSAWDPLDTILSAIAAAVQ